MCYLQNFKKNVLKINHQITFSGKNKVKNEQWVEFRQIILLMIYFYLNITPKDNFHIIAGIADGVGTGSEEIEDRVEDQEAHNGIDKADDDI